MFFIAKPTVKGKNIDCKLSNSHTFRGSKNSRLSVVRITVVVVVVVVGVIV